MADKTGIEYLDATWNPIRMTCTPVSTGCRNCWHLAMVKRFGLKGPAPMDQPTHWKRPRRIGVQFMGDLFHPSVNHATIEAVLRACSVTPRHTFFVLTKRPTTAAVFLMQHGRDIGLSNVWFGTSVERQSAAYRAIYLPTFQKAASPAGTWLSVEPMIGPVCLPNLLIHNVGWVVCGSEAGAGARECKIEWVRGLRDQCVEAGVPFFYKQGPGDDGKTRKMPTIDGRVWKQYPKGVEGTCQK